jgi:hypothetical protein
VGGASLFTVAPLDGCQGFEVVVVPDYGHEYPYDYDFGSAGGDQYRYDLGPMTPQIPLPPPKD